MKRSLIHCALLAGLVAGTAQAQVQMGNGARATELGATAVGDLAGAKGGGNTALGYSADADGGPTPTGHCIGATAAGAYASAQGCNTSSFGAFSRATGGNSTAVGAYAEATASDAAALGQYAKATALSTLAVGGHALATEIGGSAVGPGSQANAENAAAFGLSAKANAKGCVALGTGTTCDQENTVAVGNRRLTQVALGQANNDAVVVSQLRTAVETLGAGATVVNGVIVAPNYQLISGKHYSTVAGAIYDLDGRVHQLEQNPGGGGDTTGPQGPQGPTGPQGPAGQDGKDGKDGGSSTAVAGANIEVSDNGNATQTVALKDTVELSEQGSVQVAKAIHNSDGFTVQGGPSVTRSGINAGNQRVTGVAAGAIAPGSTDAINGGQLWDYQREQDDRWNLTDRRFRQLDKRVSGVCALAQANAQMATSASAIHGENRNRLAVGIGGCSGQAAISIGYTRDVTTPRGSPSAFSIGVSRSGQDTAVGAAWAIGW